MTSRQLVLDALAHKSNQVPLDFGATTVTGIHCSIVEQLRQHFGLPNIPVKITEPYQMLGEIDADLSRALGVDTFPIPSRFSMYGIEQTDWKEWLTPWGQTVLVAGNFQTTQSPDGILTYPKGNTSAPASALLPKTGFFFDALERKQPFDEDNPNLADNLEEFTDLTDADVAHWKKHADAVRANGHQQAVVASIPGACLGDIALVPAVGLEHPKGIRGVEDWYVLLATNEDFVDRLFATQVQTVLRTLEKIRSVALDAIDVAYICGTDFGTQTSTFCSPDKFRRLWLPHYKTINDWIHKNTPWKTMKHSCGAIDTLIPSLIDAGFDILNPVQCSATGMDPAHLKNKYGNQVTFWGGGVDTQQTLPFGTPAQVRDQVLQRLEIFSANGGFVFNTIHNTQAQTPIPNFLAMIDALHSFNSTK